MFFVLGFIPGYVLSWILKQIGFLRISRETELAGLDYHLHQETMRDDDELRAALAAEVRTGGPGGGTGAARPVPAE